MKTKRVLDLLVVLLLFFISFAGTHGQSLKKKSPVAGTLPYCELFEPLKYEGKVVRATAFLYIPPKGEPRVDGNTDEFFFSYMCNNRDFFAIANFPEANNLIAIRRKLELFSSEKTPTLLKVTLQAKPSLTVVPSFGHLGWLRAEFHVRNIDVIKVISEPHPMPDFDATAPILKAGSELKYLNADFMSSLFKSGTKDTVILRPDTDIIVNKKRIALTALNKISWDIGDGVAVRINVVQKHNTVWKIQGNISRKNRNGSVSNFYYENTYLKHHSNWMLRTMNIECSCI